MIPGMIRCATAVMAQAAVRRACRLRPFIAKCSGLIVARSLLGDRRIENGPRLFVVNLDPDHEGLLADLELARPQIG